jgi:hypothetical protein
VTVYPGHVVVDVTLNSHFLQAVKLENKMFVPRAAPPRGTGNMFKDRVVPPNENLGAPRVESSSQFVTIECSSLLCCVRKSCDADVFAAINESGLVYDGGIVVDEVSLGSALKHAYIWTFILHLTLLRCPLNNGTVEILHRRF